MSKLQRRCCVLPDQAWCSHTGEFRSLWQTLGHCHLCPALWWERCLFQFGLDPLKENKAQRVHVSASSHISWKQIKTACKLLFFTAALGHIIEHCFMHVFSLIKLGRGKKCWGDEISSVRPTTAALSKSGWSYCIKCRFVVVGSAPWASRLCLPDTHWWLNGHVWVQDDDLAWRRRRAGQRWRADIRAGWFDGDKKDTQSLGPQTSCHWHGLGQADKMWVTPAQMHNIPEPKSPWTLQFQSPFTINTVIKVQRSVFFFFFKPVHKLKDVSSWKQCHCVPDASPSCLKNGCDISWLLLYASSSLFLYKARAHTQESTERRVCGLWDANGNTALKQKVGKGFEKWIPLSHSVWSDDVEAEELQGSRTSCPFFFLLTLMWRSCLEISANCVLMAVVHCVCGTAKKR